MAVLSICKFPQDDILRKKAKKLPVIDTPVQNLIDSMIETMRFTHGVGLAAPQIGKSLRIITLQMPGEDAKVIINPEIVNIFGEQEVTEGCLSIPGYYGEIKRSAEVMVKGEDRYGKPIRIKGIGLMAEALEHEIDHLNGVLYIDHIEHPAKLHRIDPDEIINSQFRKGSE